MPTTPHARRPIGRAVAASLVGLSLTLAACGKEPVAAVPALPAQDVKAKLAQPAPGATKPEVRIDQAAGQVWDGGDDPREALAKQVAALAGTPVVVNLWGDWCVPCRKEMPIFQRTALALRGQVAFLGIATSSTRAKTEAYLRERIAMPYPSILDPQGKVNLGTGVDNVPKTLFYTPAGKRFVHIGPYETEADLRTDIERYAS